MSLPGSEFDPVSFEAGELKADLTELIAQISFLHAAKIADAILADYTVTRRRGVGKRRRGV